jgi:putative PIN family toxin of toxin-antitoxin system
MGHPVTVPLLDALFRKAFQALTSSELLKELWRVGNRPALRTRIAPSDLVEVLSHFEAHARMVKPTQSVHACRDPKDDVVLEVALAGAADAIVSKDEDLLVLKTFERIPIMRPGTFLAWLTSRS